MYGMCMTIYTISRVCFEIVLWTMCIHRVYRVGLTWLCVRADCEVVKRRRRCKGTVSPVLCTHGDHLSFETHNGIRCTRACLCFKEIFVRTPVKRTRIFARRWLNVRGGSERERLIVPLTPLLGTAVPVDCRKTEVKRDPAGWLSLPPPGPAGISGRASPSSSSWHHHGTHTARARARARSLVASSGGAPITERLGRCYPPVFIFSRLWWRW